MNSFSSATEIKKIMLSLINVDVFIIVGLSSTRICLNKKLKGKEFFEKNLMIFYFFVKFFLLSQEQICLK